MIELSDQSKNPTFKNLLYTSMRMFIQHLREGAAHINFIKTMKNGVSKETLEKYLPGTVELFTADNSPYLALWGQTPNKYGDVPVAYKYVEEGDPVVFYTTGNDNAAHGFGVPASSVGRAFFVGELAKKAHSKELALDSWGMLGDKRTWEHLLIIKNCRNIDIPLDFKKLIQKEYTLGGNLLTEPETKIVMEYIKKELARATQS